MTHTAPRPVYGVDFSAAERDAGEKTWVAAGTIDANGLVVHGVDPLVEFADRSSADLPSQDPPSADREEALPALASWIRELDERAVVGLDFPFGLPKFVVEATGHDSWRSFISGFPESLVGEVDGDAADPVRAFAERCVGLTETHGEGTYDKRETDAAVGARSPYGFIADTITFYGMRDVLAPVVEDVRFAPMDAADGIPGDERVWRADAPAGPTLIETYPAAVLDALGLCRTKYKGSSDAETTRRRRNAERLAAESDSEAGVGCGLTYKPDTDLVGRIVDDDGGDALDAVVACLGAATAFRNDYAVSVDSIDPERPALEGYIYALRGR